ncbi:MAG: transcription elongation factor GreB [Gammaproteobacteria bacterium]
MGRYRSPAPPRSPYITRQGYATLQAELNALWKRRQHVTECVTAAAAEGDRSENAEYIYRKKELRSIDARIRYLQKRLPELTVVDTPASNRRQVYFGAWVSLENAQGIATTYRIVGPDEFDQDKAYISMDAPMARALMKKQIDDEVIVRTPNGDMEYIITDIRYT